MRWIRLFIAALVAAAGMPSLAQAKDEPWDAPPPAWEGVWAGTVGTAPIHACLDHTPYQEKGAYYYDRVKRLLRLEPGPAPGKWFEQAIDGKNGALWTIAVQDGALTGAWSDGKKVLPLRLARIGGPSKDYGGPCADMAFHRPRLDAVHLSTKAALLEGAKYTVTTFKAWPWFDDQAEISTFSLEGSSPAITKVNALLRLPLPKPGGTGEWLDCMAANVNSIGTDGEYWRAVEPTLITNRWLGVRDSTESSCGGAHPNSDNAPRTFDLARGVEVDPLDWFGPQAVHREHYDGETGEAKTLTPAFRKAILLGWKADGAECRDAVSQQEFWRVGIARGALVFSPELPRVAMACGDDIKVPLARLRPWFNQEGRAIAALLPR